MAFVIENWAVVGPPEVVSTNRVWVYSSSSDTLATISASAYFNQVVAQLNQYDVIYVAASDTTQILVVTSSSATIPVTTTSLSAGTVNLSNIGQVTSGAPDGGLEAVIRVDMPGGATSSTNVVLNYKVRVIDAVCINRAAGTTNDTVTILNGANAITNAIGISGSDMVITRPGTINDAYWDVAAAGTLTVTETDGGGNDSPPCTVFIRVVRVP